MASSDDSPPGDHGHLPSGQGNFLAGRYRLDVPVGASNLGAVWRAEDRILGRAVTLRLLPPALSDDAELEPRLELRLARNARLPRGEQVALADLIDLIDIGRDELGRLFVVTDPHPTESLADELARAGPLPWPRLRALAVRACQLVHLSHEHGIIRQDLRTSSLYPVRDKADPGTLKVVSPGLLVTSGARVWSCPDVDVALALARHAAPEQISGGVVDRRADVYALGVILYECLTGQVPFPDPRPAHVLAAHLVSPPPPFPAAVRRRGVAPELEAIVARALAKSPDDRWPTVMALANAIAAIELGRCDASGVLETADITDLTELLEPQLSATSMRVHSDRLSGKAGPAPAPADPAATGEHAWRDILDAAESTSGLGRVESSDSHTSDSAITRASTPGDSAPTLPYGIAGDSAARWPNPPPPEAQPPGPPPRRLAPWFVAAGLSVLTAGVVAVALRPAPRPPPAPASARPSEAGAGHRRDAAPARQDTRMNPHVAPATPAPAPATTPTPTPAGTTPTADSPPPHVSNSVETPPIESPPAPALSPEPPPVPPDAPPAIADTPAEARRTASPRRPPPRPRPTTEPPALPRKQAPGGKLPEPDELPDPGGPG